MASSYDAWLAGAGGSSGGSSSYDSWLGQFGGGGTTHVSTTHKSSGGDTFLGGLFGSVAHAVEHVVHPIERPVSIINEDILHPAAHLGEGFVLGTAELGKIVGEDLYNTWRHPGLHPTKQNSHFYNDIVVPQAKDVSNKFSPIAEHPLTGKSYDPVRKDPFGTALDLLALGSIPFGGEGLTIKGATLADRAGLADTALGRGLAKSAVKAAERRAPYDVLYKPNEAAGGVFKADRARTAQGRYLYNPAREAVGSALGGKIPFVGNAARFNRYARSMADINLGPDYALLREFDHAIGAHVKKAKRLTPAERVALDIIPGYGPETAKAAELGVPRQQLLDYYTKKLALTKDALKRVDLGRKARTAAHIEQRALTRKVTLLTKNASEIDEAIKNPRPIMQQVTAQAANVADQMGHWIIDAHLAKPETIAERPYLEQKLLTGAEYSKGKVLGYEQAPANYAAKRAGYEAAIGSDITPEAGGEAGWINQVKAAQEDLKTARIAPGAKRAIKQEPGFYGGTIPFDQIPLEHPDAFYRPHTGPDVAGGGSFEPAGNSVGVPKRPGETKLNKGHRFATGQTVSGPQVWTRAGLHVLKFKSVMESLRQYEPIMVPYDGIGGANPLREGYGPVNIQAAEKGFPTAQTLSRGQKESAALDENLLSLSPEQEQAQISGALDQLFPAEHKDLTVAQYQMPLSDIKKIKGDYKRAGRVAQYLIDKPLAVWKALVLKNRPAWLVNNLFGQHALLLLHNGVQFQNYVEALSPARRKELNDAIPGLLMQGTTNLVSGSARITERRGRIVEGYYGRGARAAALAGHGAGRVINAWGDGIAKLNQEFADNVPRTTLAIRYVKEQKEALRHLEIANGALQSAVKDKSLVEVAASLTPDEKAEILRKTNRYLGDFNSMSGSSARKIRRVLPFATWFRVIMQITADLTLDHPEKLLFLRALEQAGARDRGLAPNMKLLPSWYQGSLNAPYKPGTSLPETQGLVSTTAINPFQTPVQLAQQVGSLFKTGTPSAEDNPVASLGPLAEMVNLAQGVDPFFGGTYTGPGANQSPVVRALAGTLFGLPQTRLLQQSGVAPYYQPPKSYHDTYVTLDGRQVPLDAILRYIGYPIRRVDKNAARGYAKEGR